MNKEQFLKILRRQLRNLPADELERILAYYREMIEDKVENGVSEQQAVGELGDVRTLARKILAENPNRRPKDIGKIIAVSVLSLFGVVLVACIALAAMSIHSDPNRPNSGFSITYAGTDRSEDYEYKTYTAKPDGINTVKINAENKAIEINPTNSGEITVKYAVNSSQKYNFSSDNGVFSIENKDEENNRKIGTWNNAPRITVNIPKDYSGNLLIDTGNSAIHVSDFKNLKTVQCDTANAEIKITSLNAQNLEFDTVNAAINLDTVSASAKLSADTENAAITLKKVSSPDLSLDTINAFITGSIEGREEDYTIDAKTTNAICNLHNRTGGSKKLSVSTTNALISLKFEE